MTHSVLKMIFLLTFFIFSSSISIAQTVSASVEKEIIGILKKMPECRKEKVVFDVKKIVIGVTRNGFIGSCKVSYESSTKISELMVLFELMKRRQLIQRIQFKANGYNPSITATQNLNKGYYDIRITSGFFDAGLEYCYSIYRWNGTKYIVSKKDCSL